MKSLIIIPVLLCSYAICDVFASSTSIDMYVELKAMTPKERCISAYKNTANVSQCQYL